MAHDGSASAMNDSPEKVVDVVCDCGFLWSQAHNFCYLRLSDEVAANEFYFVDLFEARARRIAATYARFYLEEEEGADPSKKGRYYWMALGAFASKTVACLLDAWQIRMASMFGIHTPFDHEDVAFGLGKGNLWLFIDIAASHWFYSNHPDEFRAGMKCETQRHAEKLVPQVMAATSQLPWAYEAISKTNYFIPSEDIIKGFDDIQQFEGAQYKEDREYFQMQSLLAIARHEQRAILQKLIYDDPSFRYWTEKERTWPLKYISPTYKLVFSSQCETDNKLFESQAPDDMQVEDYESRMDWIEEAAGTFDHLMKTETETMEDELKKIAAWVDEADNLWV